MHLDIQEYLTFNIHNIRINSIKKKEYSNVSKQLEICTYSMNEWVEEEQK